MVVPKSLLDRAGLRPGAAVEFTWRDGDIVLRPANHATALGGKFSDSGMAGRLLDDRASEQL